MTTETPIYALTGFYNDDIPMFIIGNFGGDNAVLLYDLKTFKLINRIVGHSDKVTNVNVWLQGKSARYHSFFTYSQVIFLLKLLFLDYHHLVGIIQ